MIIPDEFPSMPIIETDRIYVDAKFMFPGIEDVYPDQKIIPQEDVIFEESEWGRLHCSHCGNTRLFKVHQVHTRVNITIDKYGKLAFKYDSPAFPVGEMAIMYEDYENEEHGNTFIGKTEEFLSHNGCFECQNCGSWATVEGHVLENHDSECPGCFMCVRGSKGEAVNYCVGNNVEGNCTPGKDCSGCRGYYNMVRYSINPENIIESSKVYVDVNKKLAKAKEEIAKINELQT